MKIVCKLDKGQIELELSGKQCRKIANIGEKTGVKNVSIVEINKNLQYFADINEAIFQMEKNDVAHLFTVAVAEARKHASDKPANKKSNVDNSKVEALNTEITALKAEITAKETKATDEAKKAEEKATEELIKVEDAAKAKETALKAEITALKEAAKK